VKALLNRLEARIVTNSQHNRHSNTTLNLAEECPWQEAILLDLRDIIYILGKTQERAARGRQDWAPGTSAICHTVCVR